MYLLIDNYDSFTHNLYQMISPYVEKIQIVRNDQISITQIKSLNPKGIILSPGPGTPQKASLCLDIIAYFKDKIPILGVCLGHQAIGLVFGAKIVPCFEILHGKRSKVFHQNTNLFKGLENPYLVGRYHSLCIDKDSLPQELRIDAVSESGVIMAISHTIYPCFGLQFHPESFLTVKGYKIIKKYIVSVDGLF